MKKILLIGDSIRLGYQDAVRNILSETAVITGPDVNCRFSSFTLFHLSKWVEDSDYDIIQWNNGQWDTCYMPDGKIHTPLPIYLEYQERIASVLMTKTKRLVFATTTPVWPEMHTEIQLDYRKNEDIQKYNNSACSLLSKSGIEINDLYTPIATDIKKYISDDMVHQNQEGNLLLSKHVVSMIGESKTSHLNNP